MGKFFREPQDPEAVEIPAESITLFCSRLSNELVQYMNTKGYILSPHFNNSDLISKVLHRPEAISGYYTVSPKKAGIQLNHNHFMRTLADAERSDANDELPQRFIVRVVECLKDTGTRIIRSINFSDGQESQTEEQITGEVVEA